MGSLHGLSVAFLWINEAGGTCRTNTKNALKLRSYMFDFDHEKLPCREEKLKRLQNSEIRIFTKLKKTSNHEKTQNLIFDKTKIGKKIEKFQGSPCPDFEKINSINSVDFNFFFRFSATFVHFFAKFGSLNVQNRNNFKNAIFIVYKRCNMNRY